MTSRVLIKICGMREPENIRAVGALLPDYMGFIFYPQSPRYVGADFYVPAGLSDAIVRVGVFVNQSTETILHRARQFEISCIQLHGHEPVGQCSELKANGLKVIKVFSVGDQFDFSVVGPYKDAATYFMFDTKGKYYGGNSQVFNWRLLEQYDQEVPFFLSGGLNSENLKELNRLKGMNIQAIDLNSGVEVERGVKDVKKVTICMEQVKVYE